MPAVKEYLDRLKESESKLMASPMHAIFLEMDWLHGSMDMALEGADSLRKKTFSMPDGPEKGYALCAAKRAAESLAVAYGHFMKAESIIEKGVEKARRSGTVPKRAFSLPSVMAELSGMRDSLELLAEGIEKCTRAIEVSSGLRCENGHYISAGGTNPYDGMTAVLWSMRGLAQKIRQADMAAGMAAGRVNAARQGRSPMKAHTAIPAINTDIKKEKPSLREKLKENKIASREQYAACSREKGHNEHGMQI